MFRRRPVVVRRAGNPLLNTALIGGVGYMAGQSAARGAARESAQDARINQLEQQQSVAPAPPPPPAGTTPMGGGQAAATQAPAAPTASVSADARIEQLSKLGELRKSGVLTDAEFEAEKQKILQGN